MLSDDVRVALRPFRGYEALAEEEDPRPAVTALGRAAFLLFVIGAFVSFTAAGRLVAFHVVSTMVFWAFAPLLQAICAGATVRALGPKGISLPRALSLYFAGHAPWMVLLVLVAGVCFVAPDVYATFTWLLRAWVLPGALLGAWGWSGVLTYACFRAGLGASRGRAAAMTALFYALFVGSVVGYYLATNQIQPQL